MKNSLPCLSALVAVLFAGNAATAQDAAGGASAVGPAAAPATAPGAPASSTTLSTGDRLVVQAINQLERHTSVTAHLQHRAWIAGEQLNGVGSYWQQGSGENLRVRMELKMTSQDASMLQVSSRGYLWVDQRLPSGRVVTRTNLRQLRADPVLSAGDLESIQPGEASWSPIQPELTAHCGGLSSLLAALSDCFSFLPPQAMHLKLDPPLVPQATTIPVFAVVGHWKPARLAVMMGAGSGMSDKLQVSESAPKVPARLPQEVLLLVGQADLFPYRIEYRQLQTPRTANPNGTAIPYQLSAEPLAMLELSDVTFDVPIDGGQFDYNARDVDFVDQTTKVLERLRKQRQAEVAVRDGAELAR